LVARWRPLPGERVHVSTLFARSLEPWCGSAPPLEPVRLSPPDADLEDAREWLGDHGRPEGGSLLAIHAGAGSRDKRRPLRSFAVLARRWLMQPQNGVILVEGPAEPGLAAGLSRRLADSRVIEAAQLPLRRLAAVLSLCRVFAGNDSGVSHLAAALGVKTRVWFGPTDPAVWCPPGALVSGRKR